MMTDSDIRHQAVKEIYDSLRKYADVELASGLIYEEMLITARETLIKERQARAEEINILRDALQQMVDQFSHYTDYDADENEVHAVDTAITVLKR